MGIITILTLTLWVVTIRNKKKFKSYYSLCQQEAKPKSMITAYSTDIAEKTNKPIGDSRNSWKLLPRWNKKLNR